MQIWLAVVITAVVLTATPVHAQFSSGSTGADGAFNPASNVTVTLPANGVLNYTTVNIPSGVTVKFARNAANTPVTLLAQGDVVIAGIIDISGSPGTAGSRTATMFVVNAGPGGPGGYDGGNGTNAIVSTVGGNGLGPGGGAGGSGNGSSGAGGGYLSAGGNSSGQSANPATGGPAYGAGTLLPLTGGSGGGGGGTAFGKTGYGGGGGGGAIVIASSTTITLNGQIIARGGAGATYAVAVDAGWGGGGSGGAVRLIANTIAGTGTVDVNGAAQYGGFFGVGWFFNGGGSPGRVRIEASSVTASFNFASVTPSAITNSIPATVTVPTAPTLRIATVAGLATPEVPQASYTTPDLTLPGTTTNPVAVGIQASNVPVGTVVTSSATGTLSGTPSASTATANVTIPTNAPSVISATATFTLIASEGGGPIYAEGERVERVRVSATLGGAPEVTYITASGREILALSR
jgi:hypothetical protein